MNIDFRVYPHFFKEICLNEEDFKSKQEVLNIHKNSIADISHIKNQMRLADLDYLILHPQEESSIDGRKLVTNEEVDKLVKLYPNLFIGIGSIDPKSEFLQEELNSIKEKHEFKAIRLNLSRLRIHPENNLIFLIMDFCKKNKLSVVFESGISYDRGYPAIYANPALYEKLIIKYPSIKFCFTRFAWPYTREIVMLMMKYKNVYTDTGVLYFDSAKEFFTYLFKKEIQISWADRTLNHQILFASENPRFEQIRMSRAIKEIGLHTKTVKQIMGENTLEFLGVSL